MNERIARGIAWSLVALYITLAAVGLTLQFLADSSYTNIALPVLIFIIPLIGIWPVIGALIISRHPRHPVGWLLSLGLLAPAFDMFFSGYVSYDINLYAGTLPGIPVALLWLKWSGFPFATTAFTLMILVFPDGRPLSPFWRKVGWTAVGTLLFYLPLQAVEPGFVDPFTGIFLNNPLGVSPSLWAILKPIWLFGLVMLALCNLAAVISLVLRLRWAKGDERQQIKWLIIPAVGYFTSIPFSIAGLVGSNAQILGIAIGMVIPSVAGMVIAIAFAIFKYRLYDIDLIINRTLVYGGLTVAIAALYALSVGVASLALQQGSQWAGLLLTAGIAAILYRPLRKAVQRRVDRLLGPPPTAQDNSEMSPRAKSPKKSQKTLLSPWRRITHAAWIVCATIAWGIIILSIPASIATVGDLYSISGASEPSLWHYILNVVSFLAYTSIALISLILAGVLFLKRSNERMALFLSFFLLAYGVAAAGPFVRLETYWSGMDGASYRVILPVIVAPLLVAFLAIFPNGCLTPSWTRGLVVVAFVYSPVRWLLLNTNVYSAFTAPFIQGGLIWFGLIFSGIYAQIYRYRHVSNTTERQQTKWVVYGFTVGILLALLLTAGTFNHNRMPPGTPPPWWAPLGGLGWALAMSALPISLTFAVMRYRLYDIDILINRTLVYGALTGGVIALYALMVGAFGVLFQSGGNLMVALVATGLAAVLFQPLRVRLQRSVNRMMYGERDDPFTVLRRLGLRLESSGTPEDILAAIVETVTQALKLPCAEITLRRGETFERAARYGKEAKEMVPFPIQYQGQTIGYLNVAPRTQGESLGKPDEGLLSQIARQAGPVAHAVQLTRDLRQSRVRLVTAREEERRRLRRDLHDGLGPVLASQGLKIEAVSHLLERDPARARSILEEMASQNEATVAEIRRLVYALRPPALDELGLAGAVREYAAGLNDNSTGGTSFQVSIHLPDGKLKGLPAAVEVAAYRIATEALTNVMRHAHASHCKVSFKVDASRNRKVLSLEIADDGVGLPTDGKAGIGMNSMRERAEEVRGELHFESIPDQGTKVIACFPLTE